MIYLEFIFLQCNLPFNILKPFLKNHKFLKCTYNDQTKITG